MDFMESFKPDKALLESLWDTYDKDKNGDLDVNECTTMMSDYMKEKIKVLKNQQATTARDMEKEMAKAQADASQEERERMQFMGGMMPGGNFEAMADMADMGMLIQALEKASSNPQKMGQDFKMALDVNRDGKVSKQEFMSNFSKGIKACIPEDDECPTQ